MKADEGSTLKVDIRRGDDSMPAHVTRRHSTGWDQGRQRGQRGSRCTEEWARDLIGPTSRGREGRIEAF
jgi:hypothetical protein